MNKNINCNVEIDQNDEWLEDVVCYILGITDGSVDD